MKKYFLILLMSGISSTTHYLCATNPSVIAWITYQEKKRATRNNRLREIDNLTQEIVREKSQLERQQVLLNEPSVVHDPNHPGIGIAVNQDAEALHVEIEKKLEQIRIKQARLFQLANANKR